MGSFLLIDLTVIGKLFITSPKKKKKKNSKNIRRKKNHLKLIDNSLLDQEQPSHQIKSTSMFGN